MRCGPIYKEVGPQKRLSLHYFESRRLLSNDQLFGGDESAESVRRKLVQEGPGRVQGRSKKVQGGSREVFREGGPSRLQ